VDQDEVYDEEFEECGEYGEYVECGEYTAYLFTITYLNKL